MRILLIIFFLTSPLFADQFVYLKVPIIGNGEKDNFYRADIPRGIAYTSLIPSNSDGTPLRSDCLIEVAIADESRVPANKVIEKFTEATVRDEVARRGDLDFPRTRSGSSAVGVR